jgi:hypothetical protein
MVDLDKGTLNTAKTSNGGDDQIGSDSREAAVAWSPESEAREAEVIRILRANAVLILADLEGSTEEISAIPSHEEESNAGMW